VGIAGFLCSSFLSELIRHYKIFKTLNNSIMKKLLFLVAMFSQLALSAQNYCVPTFNPSPYVGSMSILNVRLNTINNSSAGSTAEYTNYTTNPNIITSLGAGLTYNISVTLNRSNQVWTWTEIYIDYNRDGDFFDANEDIGGSGGSTITPSPLSFNFQLPAIGQVSFGTSRMRVVNRAVTGYTDIKPSPCPSNVDWNNPNSFPGGEIEDYTVNLVCPYPLPVTPTITGNSQICATGGNQTFGLIGTDRPSYTWTLMYQGASPIAVFYPSSTYTTTGASATVHLDASPRNGGFTLQVQASNACGTMTVSKNVEVNASIPATFTGVYGPSNVCNSGPVSYFQPKPSGMYSGVVWEVTPANAVTSYPTAAYGQLNVDWNDAYTGTVQVRCKIQNGCGQSGWTSYKTVVVSNGTCGASGISRMGEEDNASGEFSAFIAPNPSERGANLVIGNSFSDHVSVAIIDAKGIIVYSNNDVPTDSEFIIGENLAVGLYTVKISNGQTQKIIKFVKN
jgi:hypothetical protein